MKKTTPREKVARRLNIFGGMLILLSFVTQNFLYDRWDSQRSDLRTAIDERAMVDKSVLLNEILYFTAQTDQVRRFKINEAARKIAISSMMTVAYNDSLATSEKTALRDRLFAEAATVNDYDSFLKFVQIVNDDYGRYSEEIVGQQQRLDRIREKARWTYLGLYLVGSLMLLCALRYRRDS